MKILIIGVGCVGTATMEGCKRLGHESYFYDKSIDRQTELIKQGYNLFKPPYNFNEIDIVFICVEEWNIDAVFREWHSFFQNFKGDIVIRSTVPPGTCKRLHKEYNCNILHNPEFLREATALHDFMNPDKIIIGCDEGAVQWINTLYSSFVNVPKIYVGTTTSEFLKLASNAILSCYISMWNQLKLIGDKISVNSHEVAQILSNDPRISKYGMVHGKQFGGFCLPKDLKTILKIADDNEVNRAMLEAIRSINELMPE